MYVAVAVQMATGTSVRALTSCIMISSANKTPPTGVLKVAAIPPPAPPAISVIRCQGGSLRTCPIVEPNDEPI